MEASMTNSELTELIGKARETTDHYIEKAMDIYGDHFSRVGISTKLRGTTAGRASYSRWEIRLNLVLFSENVEDFLKRTVPHEVAHLIAFKVYGTHIKPHGREWKSVMRNFGLTPSRCHSYDVTNSKQHRKPRKKFEYKCNCTSHAIGDIRHKRIQAGRKSFHCKLCKASLTFTGELAKVA